MPVPSSFFFYILNCSSSFCDPTLVVVFGCETSTMDFASFSYERVSEIRLKASKTSLADRYVSVALLDPYLYQHPDAAASLICPYHHIDVRASATYL